MLTSGDEKALMADIREGIHHALYLGIQRGRFEEDDISLDPISLNKLQYIVNEKQGLGLTFGWFKYGPAPVDVSDETQAGELGVPLPRDDIDYIDESRLPAKDYRSKRAFAYFFLTELGEEFNEIVTSQDTKTYLEDFYSEYAPKDELAAPFTDLYIAGVRLQQVLDSIAENDDWHDRAIDVYYDLDEHFHSVKNEISSHASLEHTVVALDEYQNFLLEVISEAGDKEELNYSQQAYISNIVRQYYHTIWNYTALEISLQTMRGENVASLRSSAEIDVEKYRNGGWKSEINGLRSRQSSMDLSPDSDLDSDDGLDLDGQSLDSNLIEKISEAGVEVMTN